MDYSELDKVRRKAVPLQLDVVEAFAAGRLSRREFIQRATVLGLSTGAIGMVIAACSGTAASPSAAASAGGSARRARRQRPLAVPRPARPRARARRPRPRRPPAASSGSPSSDPSRSIRSRCRTSAATGSPPSRSSSCAPSAPNGSDIAPGLATKWTPNGDGTVWTFDLRENVKWQDGAPFTADDVVATMERLVAAGNSGLKGVLGAGRRERHRREHGRRSRSSAATATSRTSCRSSTPRR